MPKPLIYITLFLFACNSSVKYPPGGYDYPEVVADKDTNFYHYPAKDKYSRKDSFREAYEYLFFRQFDEPNLSIRPFLDPVFRLTYGGPMTLTCIITLTPKEIILKKGVANPDFDTNNYPDTNRLAPLQRWQLRILDANYPLDEKNAHRSIWKQRFLDSIGHRYPELYDPAYYHSLYDKVYANMTPLYKYTTKKITIPVELYRRLIQQINSSGYWKLPPDIPCAFPPMDGFGFTLEANTPQKYNIVSSGSCDDDSARLFDKACQALVREAQMDREIQLYYDAKTDTVKRKPLVVQDVRLQEFKEPKPHHHKSK